MTCRTLHCRVQSQSYKAQAGTKFGLTLPAHPQTAPAPHTWGTEPLCLCGSFSSVKEDLLVVAEPAASHPEGAISATTTHLELPPLLQRPSPCCLPGELLPPVLTPLTLCRGQPSLRPLQPWSLRNLFLLWPSSPTCSVPRLPKTHSAR